MTSMDFRDFAFEQLVGGYLKVTHPQRKSDLCFNQAQTHKLHFI